MGGILLSMIQISNLSFSYETSGDSIFDHVSLCLHTDWKLGLIGRNGRGKTTLFRLLLGEFPYSGTLSSSVEFSYFPYEVPDKTKYTYEIIEQIYPDYEHWRLVKEFHLLHLSENVLYRTFEMLSFGEQTKVLLAILFLRENRFLLIDEPTNHLDEEARELIARYLNTKKGFILVSHDRKFLDTCIDHVLYINKKTIGIQQGNFSSWYENKLKHEQFETAENAKLKKEIRHLKEAATRTAGWSNEVEKTKYATQNGGLRPDRGYIGHKAAKMMKRSKSIEKRRQTAYEEKAALFQDLESADDLKLSPLIFHHERLLSLVDVSLSYGKHTVLEHFFLELNKGERVCLDGPNGCGKSTVFRLILKDLVPSFGCVTTAGGLKISYVPQNADFLMGPLKDYAADYGIDISLFFTILRKLGFARSQFEKQMEQFSAGQKKKVLLAKSLCESAHLYLWDEPLNYLDIFSRIQLEELLVKYEPTLLFIEHDSYFQEKIATRIISFS